MAYGYFKVNNTYNLFVSLALLNELNTFADSMAFLPASLDVLTENLCKAAHSFPILKASGLAKTQQQFTLLTKKGVFPYALLTSYTEFENMVHFPPRSCFFNDLSQKELTESEYKHGLTVFKVYDMQSMRDYLHLYGNKIISIAEYLI